MLLFRDMQNVFACPRERLARLEQEFGFRARE